MCSACDLPCGLVVLWPSLTGCHIQGLIPMPYPTHARCPQALLCPATVTLGSSGQLLPPPALSHSSWGSKQLPRWREKGRRGWSLLWTQQLLLCKRFCFPGFGSTYQGC